MRIGVDLGGTKIAAVALDPDGAVLASGRVPTPVSDYDGTLAAIALLVDDVEARARSGADCTNRTPVGIGTPGSPSPRTGLIRNANSTALNGRALASDLASRLQRRIRIANDANCFALSEAVDGAGAGLDVVFGVILGTGVGGGVVVGGRVIEGRNAIAGEWGHNPLPWPRDDERPGPPCYCGKRGCIEAWLSGPGFSATYERLGGSPLRADEIADRLGSHDRGATRDVIAAAAFEQYTHRLARALAHAMNLIDPDIIVLGGGVSNIAGLYDDVPALLSRYLFSDTSDTPIVPAVHGAASGVRGAAWLWPDSV